METPSLIVNESLDLKQLEDDPTPKPAQCKAPTAYVKKSPTRLSDERSQSVTNPI
jgi:hypothetical protein